MWQVCHHSGLSSVSSPFLLDAHWTERQCVCALLKLQPVAFTSVDTERGRLVFLPRVYSLVVRGCLGEQCVSLRLHHETRHGCLVPDVDLLVFSLRLPCMNISTMQNASLDPDQISDFMHKSATWKAHGDAGIRRGVMAEDGPHKSLTLNLWLWKYISPFHFFPSVLLFTWKNA